MKGIGMNVRAAFGASAGESRRTGSAAIVAVAIIVIVGMVASWLVSVVRIRNMEGANRVQAVQAYYTADAGTEWACHHATGTTSPVPFANGTFSVVPDGSVWDSAATAGNAACTVRCDQSPNPPSQSVGDGGIEYILRSRVYGSWSTSIDFMIMNTSDSAITFNALKVTWGSPVAYFESLTMTVANGTNYGQIWYYTSDSPQYRWGSGDQKTLNRRASVTLPAHYSAQIQFLNFSQNRSGWAGSPKYMNSTTATVEFYNGGTKAGQITVDLPPT